MQIQTEIADVYGRGFEGLIDAVADDAGLPADAVQKLKAEFQFGKHPDSRALSMFGAKVITAVAEALSAEIVAKEVAKVRVSEREAYDKQLQVVKGQQQQTPRQIVGGAPDPKKARPQSGPVTMAGAVAEAREILIAAR